MSYFFLLDASKHSRKEKKRKKMEFTSFICEYFIARTFLIEKGHKKKKMQNISDDQCICCYKVPTFVHAVHIDCMRPAALLEHMFYTQIPSKPSPYWLGIH